MNTHELAGKVKKYRIQKGFSQEELGERAGLSLRTVQRIENGETIPRGDSVQRLSAALNLTPDDLLSWEQVEDNSLLISLNLSSLCFLLFPLLGVIVPLIIWVSKKDKVRDLNRQAKRILNFQITWNIVLFIGFMLLVIYMASLNHEFFSGNGDVSPTIFAGLLKKRLFANLAFLLTMYLYNLIFILVNSRRISKNKEVKYFPAIRFLQVN